ncbi:hypothetical protein HPB50_021118 [Hyalomma asiaticum]|uniref:Uncharacterized protein n=1 Tax=Hyalomma asiaticum TaxID=266040 RepID=A0ACB7TKQ6_HYAAI|nr:hypothetical protein HPB50_021118 [Hyalomma asiaticum]
MHSSKGRLALDEGETNSKPPFRPTCHDIRGTVPSLNDYESFLKEDRSFCDGARKFDEGVVASTRNAAASRHSKCIGHSGTLPLGSGYASSMGFEPATRMAILGRSLVVARRRRVATKSTPPKVIPSHVKTKGRNQKRRSTTTLTCISFRTGSPKANTPRLEAQESVTARPTDVSRDRVDPQD